MKFVAMPLPRFGWVPAAVVLVLSLLLASCSNTASDAVLEKIPRERPSGPPLFEEVTAASGVNFVYRNGEEADHYAILEALGGGVAVLDFDGDGLMDLFIPGGGTFTGKDKKTIEGCPCKLYKNLGNGKFRDVTDEIGFPQPTFYSHGAAVGDFDKDGFPDLLVTGYGGIALYRNVPNPKGGRRFVDVTKEAGLTDKIHWATSAAFADLDGDSYPDLYICQYIDWSWTNHPRCRAAIAGKERDVCSPRTFQAVPHLLYRNTGKGTFENVSTTAGLALDRDGKSRSKGLAVLIADVNDDRKPDVYVGNDTTDNLLYMNESTPGTIRLREKGFHMGVATDDQGMPQGSMGLDIADIDGSGLPAFLVATYEQELNALYQMSKTNKECFVYRTHSSGIAVAGNQYVGWGTGFLDLDNDGWMDMVITNGHVHRYPARGNLRQKAILFRNKGKGLFAAATAYGGPFFQEPHRGRGLAIVDLDNDGRPDLVVSCVNEPVAILRNVCDSKNHWLGVNLQGEGHRDTVGAKLTLEVGSRVLTQWCKGGGSFASARDPRLLFGLGQASKVGRLTVYWPTGMPRVEHWDNLPINGYRNVVQGKGQSGP